MSSIPPNDPSRGCASNFPQPVGQRDLLAAENLVTMIARMNLNDHIVYRPSDLNYDIRHPLVRWDTRPYQEIFASGFQARAQGDTLDSTYYNLYDFIHSAGAPLDPTRRATHTFVSTTLNDAWQPTPNIATLPRGGGMTFYRYEIYAPGGIWVAVTLGDRYRHLSQAEVCFVGGIAPQYIRSCIEYSAIRDVDSSYVSFIREDTLIINGHFNPQAYPYVEVVPLFPIHSYVDDNGVERDLPEKVYTPDKQKREVLYDNNDAALDWYKDKVLKVSSYVDAAFRSTRNNEAYLFMKNKYALINYAPGTTDDKILNGPLLICEGFPSLIDTPFGEQGIECAFDTDYDTGFPFYTSKTEAFIFSGNLCAYIDYAPGTTDDKILSGPMTIAAMFPCFKDTVFEKGIDAAFRSSRSHEAYLFKGDQYALLDYDSKNRIAIRKITDGFPSLFGTIFASDIDAAFASHRENEAYLFKGESYALINFAPGTTDDYIVGGRIKPILPNWSSLNPILPLYNNGLVSHVHHHQEQDHEPDQHDDL